MSSNQELKSKETWLEAWARWAAVGWKRSLIIAAAVTVAAAIGIALLHLDLTFYSIMPKNSRAAADLEEIVTTFPSASTIVAVVEGDKQTIGNAADSVAEALRSAPFSDQLNSVEARIDEGSIEIEECGNGHDSTPEKSRHPEHGDCFGFVWIVPSQ